MHFITEEVLDHSVLLSTFGFVPERTHSGRSAQLPCEGCQRLPKVRSILSFQDGGEDIKTRRRAWNKDEEKQQISLIEQGRRRKHFRGDNTDIRTTERSTSFEGSNDV